MWAVNFFFQIAAAPTVCSSSYKTRHTWSACQYAKKRGTDFWNFDFKIVGEFL